MRRRSWLATRTAHARPGRPTGTALGSVPGSFSWWGRLARPQSGARGRPTAVRPEHPQRGSMNRAARPEHGRSQTRPPRVLVVSGEYPPTLGGVGDYTARLVAALGAQGIEVGVL